MSGIYLGDLINFLRESFPINPNANTSETKNALEQFEVDKIGRISVIRTPVLEWAQGDIINSIPFIGFSEDGELSYFTVPGMIITSSCDLDRKENVVFCPCFPLEKFRALSVYEEVIKNRVFEFFYIGRVSTGEEWVVDLSCPMTLLRDRVLKRLQSGDIYRLHSLTQVGWYLFITKFSMKYFRPDDLGTMNSR